MNTSVRWFHLVLGTILMLFLGMLYAWSIFRTPLQSMFQDWTTSQLSLTFSISIMTFCLGNIISGKLAAIVSSRVLFLAAGVLLFAGFLGTSFSLSPDSPATSLILLYIFYGGGCGLGVGIGYNTLIGTLVRWFPDRVGLASGIMLMGFGMGGLVLGGIISVLISKIGLSQTFITIAICIAAILALSALRLKKPDAATERQLQALKKKSGDQTKTSLKRPDSTSSEMLRSPAFWLFFLWLICISSGGLLVINSAAPIAESFGVLAVMGLIVSLFNGGGRVFYGLIFDKFGAGVAILCNGCMLFASGAILLLAAKTNSTLLLFIGLPLTGVCFGGAPAITSAAVNFFWGAKHFPANFGLTNCNLIPAALLGPMVSSTLLQRSGGTYDTTFMMMVVIGVIAIALSFFLLAFMRKR